MNWLSMFRRPWGKEGIQFRRLTPSMAIGSTLSQLTIVWQGDFKLLLCELSRQEEKISVLQPKADYFDAVLSCPRSHPHHPDRQRLWLVRDSDEQISPREEHPVLLHLINMVSACFLPLLFISTEVIPVWGCFLSAITQILPPSFNPLLLSVSCTSHEIEKPG